MITFFGTAGGVDFGAAGYLPGGDDPASLSPWPHPWRPARYLRRLRSNSVSSSLSSRESAVTRGCIINSNLIAAWPSTSLLPWAFTRLNLRDITSRASSSLPSQIGRLLLNLAILGALAAFTVFSFVLGLLSSVSAARAPRFPCSAPATANGGGCC